MSELPTGWVTARVEELAALVQYGSSQKTTDEPRHAVPVLRMGNIHEGKLRLEQLRFLPTEHDEFPALLLQPGDVLFNRTNSFELVGKTAVYDGAPSPCSFASYLIRVRLNDYDPRLFAAFVNSPSGRDWIASSVSQQVGQANVSGGKLSQLEIPVPPFPEQKRIADKLDALLARVDACRGRLDRVPAILKRFRQSVLAAATSGELTREWREARGAVKRPVNAVRPNKPQSLESLAALPPGWCWSTVDEVGEITLGRQRAPQYMTGEHFRPYLRVANIKDDRIDFSDVHEMDFDENHFAKYALLSGDILVSEGQSPELLGQSAIYRGGVDGLCFQKTLHRFRANPKVTSPEYAQLVFRSHVATGLFKSRGSITTNIAHLTLERFRVCPFPLPPFEEQQRIVAVCTSLLGQADALATRCENARGQTDKLTPSLLAKAFRGELVPQDPSDEPASVLLARLKGAEPVGAKKRKGKSAKA